MTNHNPYADLFKSWSDYKAPQMPGFDFSQALNSSRRNAEAVTAAGQTVAESVQAIARRQAELARAHVEKVLKTTKEMLVNGSPEINTTKQVELAKTVFESSLNNLREVSELCTKSGFEVFDVLNKRASATIEEISGHHAPKSKKAA
jgi:phasin family protein